MARLPLDLAKRERIDKALREMVEHFSAQPIPGRLLSILDQLDDEEPTAARKAKRQGR
jgi:hypothetical protein